MIDVGSPVGSANGTDPTGAAAAVRQVLAAERGIGEAHSALTDRGIEAIEAAGLFRMLVAPRWGGLGVPLDQAIDATAELAGADPAASWVVMILNSSDWLVGRYPDRALHEVYQAGPDTRVCAVLSPKGSGRRVRGGWVLSGSWLPASGCLHAQWALLGFRPDAPGDLGGVGLALVPMAELAVRHTWSTTGLRATGSHTLLGSDVVVPDHRVLPLPAMIAGEYQPDTAARYGAVLPTLATYLIAPCLGMATAALDHAVAVAGSHGVAFTSYRRYHDSTAFQLAVAEATAQVDVARLTARHNAEVVACHARQGRYPDYLTRARIRLHAGHAVRQCREAVDGLVAAIGASAFAESDPLSWLARDLHTAAAHGIADATVNAELFGRAVLGVVPNITELI